MVQKPTVLIIGRIDSLRKLSVGDYFNPTFAANYGEAIERLGERMFNYVITDAVLPEGKSALNILKYLARVKKSHRTFVCHNKSVCETKLGTWMVETYFKAYFTKFASFHLGTIESCLNTILAHEPQCA